MTDAAAEIARLRAALAAAEARADTAERELAGARGLVSAAEAAIQHLRLEIAKLRRAQYGRRCEGRARLIDQMELHLEELEAAATEDAIEAARKTPAAAAARRRPAKKPFPEHLPRERVVVEPPTACACCGSERIVKLANTSSRRWRSFPAVGR